MFTLMVTRTLPRPAIAHALATLGDALPPGFLLGLAQGVNKHTPRSVADTLIVRSTCQLRQLQAAAPQLRLPSGPRKLLEAIGGSRRRCTREERALAQALFEFYIGLVLRLLTFGNPRSPGHRVSARRHRPLSPPTLVLGFSPGASGAGLKHPPPA